MKNFFIVIALLICTTAKAQEKNTNAILSIQYDFKYITDTLVRNKIYSEKMILYLNETQSSFLSYSKKIEDSIALVMIDSMMNTGVISSQKKANRIQTTIHKYFRNDTFSNVQEYLNKFFLIKTVQKPISWQIKEDKKRINGFLCQRAACFLKGRSYEVWFTNEIPISAGPWKLNGLPGLILEAKDLKSEVVFLCTEINQINYKNNYLSLPDLVTFTTQKEFDDLKEYYTNNPAEALKVVIGNNDFSMKIGYSQLMKSPKRVIKKPSNPIELTSD
jgi:GLPGLI family protein